MSDLPLSPDDVAEIVALLDGGGYDRLDIRTTRFRLRVNREGEGWTQDWDYADSGMPQAKVAVEETSSVAVPDGLAGVFSPLPGTFYRAPSPGAPPFVEVGDSVGPETVVGIVETMKLMNPVHAGCSGTVTAILGENAAMVEKGAVLMYVEPA